MTHTAVEYDRTAWRQDLNAIITLNCLEEMAADREIGSVVAGYFGVGLVKGVCLD